MCYQKEQIYLLVLFKFFDELFQIVIYFGKFQPFAETRVLTDWNFRIVISNESHFHTFLFSNPIRRKNQLFVGFVIHIRYDDVGFVTVHHLQHYLFAIDNFPISGNKQIVLHSLYKIGKYFTLKIYTFATSLYQISTIDKNSSIGIFFTYRFYQGFDIR